ncbi:RNA polymerase sigma factor [Blautia schinkii]|nr:RNA polymerase sigma factor [Blautia schinkii]
MYQEEWKTIYVTYYKPLYLYALSLTGNQQDAEDLLQETFVKAFLSYKNTGSIKYWLVTVLRNEFLNLQRKRKKEVLDEGQNYLVHKASDVDILSDLIEKEERRLLFYAIQELPDRMKEVLIESVYFQLKDDEIGNLHGLTNESVRKIRSRAKQKLIEKMKEEK